MYIYYDENMILVCYENSDPVIGQYSSTAYIKFNVINYFTKNVCVLPCEYLSTWVQKMIVFLVDE